MNRLFFTLSTQLIIIANPLTIFISWKAQIYQKGRQQTYSIVRMLNRRHRSQMDSAKEYSGKPEEEKLSQIPLRDPTSEQNDSELDSLIPEPNRIRNKAPGIEKSQTCVEELAGNFRNSTMVSPHYNHPLSQPPQHLHRSQTESLPKPQSVNEGNEMSSIPPYQPQMSISQNSSGQKGAMQQQEVIEYYEVGDMVFATSQKGYMQPGVINKVLDNYSRYKVNFIGSNIRRIFRFKQLHDYDKDSVEAYQKYSERLPTDEAVRIRRIIALAERKFRENKQREEKMEYEYRCQRHREIESQFLVEKLEQLQKRQGIELSTIKTKRTRDKVEARLMRKAKRQIDQFYTELSKEHTELGPHILQEQEENSESSPEVQKVEQSEQVRQKQKSKEMEEENPPSVIQESKEASPQFLSQKSKQNVSVQNQNAQEEKVVQAEESLLLSPQEQVKANVESSSADKKNLVILQKSKQQQDIELIKTPQKKIVAPLEVLAPRKQPPKPIIKASNVNANSEDNNSMSQQSKQEESSDRISSYFLQKRMLEEKAPISLMEAEQIEDQFLLQYDEASDNMLEAIKGLEQLPTKALVLITENILDNFNRYITEELPFLKANSVNKRYGSQTDILAAILKKQLLKTSELTNSKIIIKSVLFVWHYQLLSNRITKDSGYLQDDYEFVRSLVEHWCRSYESKQKRVKMDKQTELNFKTNLERLCFYNEKCRNK